MSAESAVQVIGEVPLSVLVESAEERVRLLAERLDSGGVLTEDPGLSALLVDVRVRLLVAKVRLESEQNW